MKKGMEDKVSEEQLRALVCSAQSRGAEGRPHGGFSSSQGAEGQRWALLCVTATGPEGTAWSCVRGGAAGGEGQVGSRHRTGHDQSSSVRVCRIISRVLRLRLALWEWCFAPCCHPSLMCLRRTLRSVAVIWPLGYEDLQPSREGWWWGGESAVGITLGATAHCRAWNMLCARLWLLALLNTGSHVIWEVLHLMAMECYEERWCHLLWQPYVWAGLEGVWAHVQTVLSHSLTLDDHKSRSSRSLSIFNAYIWMHQVCLFCSFRAQLLILLPHTSITATFCDT